MSDQLATLKAAFLAAVPEQHYLSVIYIAGPAWNYSSWVDEYNLAWRILRECFPELDHESDIAWLKDERLSASGEWALSDNISSDKRGIVAIRGDAAAAQRLVGLSSLAGRVVDGTPGSLPPTHYPHDLLWLRRLALDERLGSVSRGAAYNEDEAGKEEIVFERFILEEDPFLASALLLDYVAEERSRSPARIAASPTDPPNGRLTIDQQACRATLDGTTHTVSPDAVTLLRALLDAKGDWVSGPELTKRTCVARPDRVLKKVPAELGDLVESSTAKGYRISLARLA